jgi:hypothetical protein
MQPALPASSMNEAASSKAPGGEPRHDRPTPALVEPVSEARYRIQLNASLALKEKLERLQALTRHSNPSGDIALVIERALDLALEQVEKRRFGKTNKPRPPRATLLQTKWKRTEPKDTEPKATPLDGARRVNSQNGAEAAPEPRSRAHIPNATRREIEARDETRCTYRAPNGCRCTAQAFLQFHHDECWALGGSDQVSNLRLLCAAHNRLLAEQQFGERYVAERQAARRNDKT